MEENQVRNQAALQAKGHALELMTAATQILTVMCLVKGNSAWKGSLALLFFGGAAELFFKYGQSRQKAYLGVGIGLGCIGLALLVWFGVGR